MNKKSRLNYFNYSNLIETLQLKFYFFLRAPLLLSSTSFSSSPKHKGCPNALLVIASIFYKLIQRKNKNRNETKFN